MRGIIAAALLLTSCNPAPQDRPTPDRHPGAATTRAAAFTEATTTARASASASASGSASALAAPPPPPSPPSASPGDDVSVSLLAQLCTSSTCAGDLARVGLWRDGDGRLGVLHFYGDVTRCSHPPSTISDWAGKELFLVANRPVTPEKAKEIQTDIRQRTAPFAEAERVNCAALLAGRWRPKAAGRRDRTVDELKAEIRQRASYVVVGDVWTLRDCPPSRTGKRLDPCDHHGVDLVDSATDRTPEAIFVQYRKNGPLVTAAKVLTEGSRFRLLVEPAGNLGKRSRAMFARFDLVAVLGKVTRPPQPD